MPITVDPARRVFTLHTARSTYQFRADGLGNLLHLYYGRRSEGHMDYLLTNGDRGFSGNPYAAGTDRSYSLDALPQEFPVQGSGDYRSPALMVRDARGVWGSALHYTGFALRPGKYALPGLPAVYADSPEDGAETLEITMENERLGLRLRLLYAVLPRLDIITRAAVVENRGAEAFTVEKLQSACLDFVGGDFDLTTFHGRHTYERQPDRRPLGHGLSAVGSRRGMSSHQYNPLVILSDRDTSETAGRCWALEFVWSGGFLAEAERDQYGQTRVQMGLMRDQFSYPLAPGESLCAPEVILSYSGEGFETLSHNLHRCLRERVCRGPWRDAPRPVLLNSWEASYFDFSGASILALAKEAKALGAELLVLDDGWFGSRSDDYRALGDWTANEDKLGCSLGELIRRVRDEGLRFGIWMEPEMVSEDSELYRAHPDWALAVPGEAPVRARHQLVLDLSRREVREELFRAICAVMDQGEVDYLKWDYNRCIAEAVSPGSAAPGKVLYDYMLGLYELLERLLARYPGLLIEGCSGGGGRFDAGMLYYCPQIWCSDNTDPADRLRIQYGTSFGYPASCVGAHVSASPNHQTGRSTPLRTRETVALSGGFGYELDPAKLTEKEREELRRGLDFYRAHEALIRRGRYFRLTDPLHSECCAWEYAAGDGSEALVAAVPQEVHGNKPTVYIRLRGLTPGALYADTESGALYPSPPAWASTAPPASTSGARPAKPECLFAIFTNIAPRFWHKRAILRICNNLKKN